MEALTIVLSILAISILNILCFFIGAKVGQLASKGEEIKAPDFSKLNPVKIYEEHKEKVKADRESEKINTILHNIEVYDGTGAGQKEVPYL